MDVPLAISILGAGIGAGTGYAAAGLIRTRTPKSSSRTVGAATGGIAGALLGHSFGLGLNHFISEYRCRKLDDVRSHIQSGSPIEQRSMKSVAKKAPKNVTYYEQVGGGRAFDNGMFVAAGGDPGIDRDYEWRNIRTGKKEKPDLSKNNIFLGRDYRSVDVLAHEIGHAEDLNNGISPERRKRRFFANKASALLPVAGIATLALSKGKLAIPAATLVAAGLVAGAYSRELTREAERSASTNAVKYLQPLDRPEEDKELMLAGLEHAYRGYDPVQLNDFKLTTTK